MIYIDKWTKLGYLEGMEGTRIPGDLKTWAWIHA